MSFSSLKRALLCGVPYSGACVPINQPDEAEQASEFLGLIAEWWIVARVQ